MCARNTSCLARVNSAKQLALGSFTFGLIFVKAIEIEACLNHFASVRRLVQCQLQIMLDQGFGNVTILDVSLLWVLLHSSVSGCN